eukprot:TRINITY_DN31389_c0_g1_i1.p2 TRINITY_DN31389_c0_g1~~TRINITY_DN31389_c0_g1_i1.p2  ORF type:complete len:124 (+),score=15.45 TRINITY_DN31389_c0_g1_i1:153-524(+)
MRWKRIGTLGQRTAQSTHGVQRSSTRRRAAAAAGAAAAAAGAKRRRFCIRHFHIALLDEYASTVYCTKYRPRNRIALIVFVVSRDEWRMNALTPHAVQSCWQQWASVQQQSPAHARCAPCTLR